MTLTLKKWLLFVTVPFIFVLLLTGLIVFILLPKSDSDPMVETKVGTIQGLKAKDGDYNMYLGIPYAHVDENNVFGPSIQSEKFKEVFQAHNDSVICPQYDELHKSVSGSLDCLRLNVYVPKSACCKIPLPVLVFIHGGEYKLGFGGKSLYGPKYLMKHDIIIVTINYRLGPYGFLCVDIPDVSGNQGLKDQILALRWVKDNIESFGGDPQQVTVAGVGSGGENVNLHVMYGEDKLFQRAIIESGIYIDQLDEEDGIESIPIALADDMGFETDKETTAMNFLKARDPESVIDSSITLRIQYGPCVESNYSKVKTFISSKTLRSKAHEIRKIPILIGQSNKETLKIFAHHNFDNSDIRNMFRYDMIEHFKLRDEILSNAVNNLSQFYELNVGGTDKNKIIDFKSDLYHNFPTKRMIDIYLKKGAKIYYDVFSYSGENNFAKKVNNITGEGATQEDVLGYLFDMPFVKKPVKNEDQLVIDRMTTLWANFVKYGNPTPKTSDLIPVKWEPVTAEKLNCLEISSELTPKIAPFSNRTAFWDEFYKHNKEIPLKPVEPWKIL